MSLLPRSCWKYHTISNPDWNCLRRSQAHRTQSWGSHDDIHFKQRKTSRHAWFYSIKRIRTRFHQKPIPHQISMKLRNIHQRLGLNDFLQYTGWVLVYHNGHGILWPNGHLLKIYRVNSSQIDLQSSFEIEFVPHFLSYKSTWHSYQTKTSLVWDKVLVPYLISI